MHTTDPEQRAPGRTRRTHSAEFKSRLVQASRQPGVSLASVAVSNGINPSLLRRWVVQQASSPGLPMLPKPACVPTGHLQFVPVAVSAPAEPTGAISIEVTRAGVAVAIRWPVEHASACAALLRELLR